MAEDQRKEWKHINYNLTAIGFPLEGSPAGVHDQEPCIITEALNGNKGLIHGNSSSVRLTVGSLHLFYHQSGRYLF